MLAAPDGERLKPDTAFLQKLCLETTGRGIKVERATMATSREGVFAAGAVAGAGAYAVHSSASGRRAAESIAAFLAGEKFETARLINVRMRNLTDEDRDNLFKDFPKAGRIAPERISEEEARSSATEMDKGFSPENAVKEASRCFQCACAKKDACALRIYASEYGADPAKYGGARQTFERELTHEDVVYEPAKCIKCGRCVLIAGEAKEALGLSFIGRGFNVKIAVPFDEKLKTGLEKIAAQCVAACPTGALSHRRRDG